jgi:hypothetical protein
VELLFTLAHWHALAKLRMHTDASLAIMDEATTQLGHQLWTFNRTTSQAFQTRELRREAEARIRRNDRNTPQRSIPSQKPGAPPITADTPGPSGSSSSRNTAASSTTNTQRPKTLNLNTYKLHALGHYTDTIRQYGTTDSYTTELVCTA